MTDLFPLTPAEWETLRWYLWHGGLAFLAILIVTAIVEHFTDERDWQ